MIRCILGLGAFYAGMTKLGLSAFGAIAIFGLVVAGTDRPPRGAVVTEGDHRIAMAMALVGLRRTNLSIADPHVVAKSWPEFWNLKLGEAPLAS